MTRVSDKNDFVYLTISLVILLLVASLVDQFPIPLGQHVVQALTVLTLASGVVGLHVPLQALCATEVAGLASPVGVCQSGIIKTGSHKVKTPQPLLIVTFPQCNRVRPHSYQTRRASLP